MLSNGVLFGLTRLGHSNSHSKLTVLCFCFQVHVFNCGALSNQVLATIGQAFVKADEAAEPCEEYQEVEEEYRQLEEEYEGDVVVCVCVHNRRSNKVHRI